MAESVGGPATVLTFDPHPVRVLRPDQAPPPLTWTNRKADLLAELGVDVVIAWPTDRELLSLSHIDFFESIVVGQIAARAMVEGPNFFFGHNREGNVDRLADLCKGRGINLEIVVPVIDGDDFVSSSRVRHAIAAGDVDTARAMLTQPYRIRGMVTHGAGRGKSIGFPTANLSAIDTLTPPPGVYAGQAFVDGNTHAAAVHIGPNPTFGEHAVKVEVHLLGYDDSLYGSVIEVAFYSRLRDIVEFDSVDELKKQLKRDIEASRKLAAKLT